MTPVLSYSTGREGESSGRIINAMKKKLKQYENSFQTTYTNKKLQQGAVGVLRFKFTLRQAEAGAHCSYMLWATYGCEYAGTWRFHRLFIPNGFIFDALGTNYKDPS